MSYSFNPTHRINGLRALGVDLDRNIHWVDANHLNTRCPECSDSRKKNYKQKCLAVDLKTGRIDCSHCGLKKAAHTDEFLNKNHENFNYAGKPINEYTNGEITKEIFPVNFQEFLKEKHIMLETQVYLLEKKLITFGGNVPLRFPSLTKKKEEDKIKSWGGKIMFPYWSHNNHTLYKYKVRTPKLKLKSNAPKFITYPSGAKSYIFNAQGIVGQKTAIIVEGETDVFTWIQAGFFNTFTIDMGAPKVPDKEKEKGVTPKEYALSQDFKGKFKALYNAKKDGVFDSIETFYIAVDEDEPGEVFRHFCIDFFGDWKCKIIRYYKNGKNDKNGTWKDANEVISPKDSPTKGLGIEKGSQFLYYLFNNAESAGIYGTVKLKDIESKINEARTVKTELAASSYIPEFDKHFRWHPGIHVGTGYPNTGKSYLWNYIMLAKTFGQYTDFNFTGRPTKWGVIAPEHYPVENFYKYMMRMLAGRPLHEIDDIFFEALKEFINTHFIVIIDEENENQKTDWTNISKRPKDKRSRLDPLQAIERFAKLHYSEGIEGFLIDPWNYLNHSGRTAREDEYLADLLSEYAKFSRELKLFGGIIAHPRSDRDELIRDKRGQWTRPKMTIRKLSGGAMWHNMADFGWVVDRPNFIQNHEDTAVSIDFEKIRDQNKRGKPKQFDGFNFDPNTGWYYSQDTQWDPINKEFEGMHSEDMTIGLLRHPFVSPEFVRKSLIG